MKQPVCSDSSLAAGEPLLGSAPHAVAWLCLEQPGPWGAKAFTHSHLDPVVGAQIEQAAGAVGVRPALVRRPGHHADVSPGARTVLAAYTHPDGPWLLTATVADPALLLDLDWGALARGDRDAVAAGLPGSHDESPQLLVCTNGTRDTCCARLGRPVATAAAAAAPGRVWEVTHTSGHRFAPTSVLLPTGYLHGRILDAVGLFATTDAGVLPLDGLRGRSTWPTAGQVAEEHVRRAQAIDDLDALTVTGGSTDWLVHHRDGRTWPVHVTPSTPDSPTRAESCGKAEKPITRYAARLV